jgi:hypothetical protein
MELTAFLSIPDQIIRTEPLLQRHTPLGYVPFYFTWLQDVSVEKAPTWMKRGLALSGETWVEIDVSPPWVGRW